MPLVRLSAAQKKFIAVGTIGASFGEFLDLVRKGAVIGPHGAAKAALHFLVMLYSAELDSVNDDANILFTTVHPGIVDTDMLSAATKKMAEGAMDDAEGILNVAKELTKERSGNLSG